MRTGAPAIPEDRDKPTLREAMRRLARFLGRKGDGEPGAQTLWTGLQRFDDIIDMFRAMSEITHAGRASP